MIVSCPDCGARYRVREEKLPPGGGNIQCPACSHVFAALANVVTAAHVTGVAGVGPSTPAATAGDPAPTMLLSQQTRPRAENPFHSYSGSVEAVPRRASTGAVAAASPFGTPSAPPPKPEAAGPPPALATDVTAIVRPPEPEPTVALSLPSAPPPSRQPAKEQWKLRSPVGLVYDFPDLSALKSWLSTRDSVDGMSASRDAGVTWELLTAFAELRSSLPKSARLALSRAEPSVEAAKTTMLQRPIGEAPPAGAPSSSQPPAARPLMTTALPAPSPERPVLTQPSGSYAMAPSADSPLRRELLTSNPLPSARPGSNPVASGSAPKRPPARPSIRSGGHAAVPAAAGAGTAAQLARASRQPAAEGRRGPAARSRPRVGSRPRRPVPRRAGTGTWLGLTVIGALIVAATLQLTGVVDLVGVLGLRSTPPANEVLQPVPDPEARALAENATPGRADTATPPPSTADGADTATREPTQRELRRRGISPHASRIATLTNQARVAAGDGRIEEAIDLVNNALQFDRSNPDAVCLLADLQREAGSFGEAETLAAQCDALRSTGANPGTEP